MTSGRRLAASLLASVVLNLAFVTWMLEAGYFRPVAPHESSRMAVRVEQFVVPRPSVRPTPPAHWDQLDRSLVRYAKAFPDHLQIVLLAAKQRNGRPSDAPNIFRVDISPTRIHERTLMHIRVFTSPDANGVYIRFAIWEIAVAPVAAGHFDPADPDFPGRPYERFERDYTMPPIPPLLAGRAYNVQVAAVGRKGLASGAYINLYLENTKPR
jgi:hypothetical protein